MTCLDADADAGAVANFLPEAIDLAQYKAIVYQTGDNFRRNGTLHRAHAADHPRHGPPGGVRQPGRHDPGVRPGPGLRHVIRRQHGRAQPFFYSSVLGAEYLQDSVNGEVVFEDSAQLLTGVPGSPLSNTSFDISAMGDGAGNQAYVDEIKNGCTDPDLPADCAVYTPLLKYSVGGNNVEEGYVALAHYDFPTLERPGVSLRGHQHLLQLRPRRRERRHRLQHPCGPAGLCAEVGLG